jgi:hypothetical protein
MDILSTDQTFNELNYASPNVVYLSLKDSSSTCGSYLSELSSLPSGWSYHCSATPTNIDGTGWIPIPFSNFPILNISQLFIDPINKPPYYYSFVVGGSYEVTAKPEINYSPAINDGGIEPILYEVGSNKKLSTFQSGLVLYLPFDEGTGTIAYDLSGYGNNGTLVNNPQWVDGKAGKALMLNGSNYVDLPSSPALDATLNNFTILVWVTFTGTVFGDDNGFVQYKYVYNDSGYTVGVNRYNLTSGNLRWCDVNWRMGDHPYQSPETSSLNGYYCYDNQWNFYAYVRDINIGKITMYANGQKIGQTNTYPGTLTVQGSYINRIGGPGVWGGYLEGSIDEVRVYNRALSDSEIKALYDATK